MNIVYSKEICPYCDMAKNLLKSKGIQFEEKVVGVNFTREELLEAVPNAKTVPQIWWNDKHIGGFSELAEEIDNTRGGFGDGF